MGVEIGVILIIEYKCLFMLMIKCSVEVLKYFIK